MVKRKKLSIFVLGSVFLHLIAAVALSNLLSNEKMIISSIEAESYQPVIVSMLKNSKTKDIQKKAVINNTTRSVKKPSTQTLGNVAYIENIESANTQVPVKHKNSTLNANESVQTARTEPDTNLSNINSNETHADSDLAQAKDDRKLAEYKNSETKGAMIRKKLSALIERNFSYPRFAIKRGWEGTVELGLRVEANGKLSNVRVVKTSGYSILDEAALTALTETNYINGLDAWMAGNHFDTTLPVKYQLVGG